jgi:hypothetical protein
LIVAVGTAAAWCDLVLNGWDEAELTVQAPVVVPVDEFGDGDRDVVDAWAWALVGGSVLSSELNASAIASW